jgi:hypothetical protein
VNSLDAPATTDPTPGDEGRGQVRRALGGTKELVRIAYRDPAHIPERLTLHAMSTLAEPSRVWAETARQERPDASPAEIAEDLRLRSAKVARIDGAVAGTPFFIALVPGYISYLWQEARMGLRTAALFDRDPAALRTAAEMLSLRGVHPTIDAAESALRKIDGTPPPVQERRSLRSWVAAVKGVLVFGGFLQAPKQPSGDEDADASGGRLRAVGGLLFGAAIWATTWLVPVTFMIAMAWACETHIRQLGLRTLALYGGEGATTEAAIALADRHNEQGRTKRQLLRSALLALSVAIPIAFVAYMNHVRQDTGVSWLGAVAALVALSLVIAGAVYGSRR